MLIGHRKFLIFLFLSNCIFHNITASESVATKKIVCYIGTDCSKRLGRGSFHINDLNADLCTHVILGFARLKDERTIDLLASWIEFMKGTNITSVKKKFPGVIFMVAVGGWYNGVQPFIKFTDHKENQKIFAQTALDFVKKHDFDGLELCWLYPTKRGGYISDRKTFVELLKAKNNLLFSVLISGAYTTISSGYNVPEIFKNVDFVDIISYDYNGLWSDKIAPNAPLYSNDQNNVNYTAQILIKLGADREKMIIGIPFYGRNFFAAEDQSSKPNIGDFFDKNKERIRTFTGPYMRDESGDIAYNEICLEKLIPNKWENHWDQKSKTPYLITTDKLITYENAESIKYKVKYAFQEKLGGVMIFSIDQDDFRGDCFNKSQDNDEFKTFPMLRNLNRTFRNCLETHKTHKQDETRKQLDKPMKSFLISRSKLNKSNPIFTLFIFIFIYRFYL